MAGIDFAAARQRHIMGCKYERIREAWFTRAGNAKQAAECRARVRHHRQAADDALMGIQKQRQAK